jgi:serine/threonine protein kinase
VPGTFLRAYEIEDALGTGSSAAVYRAKNRETGARVALKRATTLDVSARWEIEARLLSELDHPAVVSFVDHFEEPEGVYNLVMRLVDGIDLARVLWDRAAPGLPVDDVIGWMRGVGTGLMYLHDQQIVHGDLKPRNIVRERDRAVIVDFGLAGRIGTSDDQARGGTPQFMAPEVFAGDAPTPSSDVYSLGATIWTLLTGTPPPYGEGRRLDSIVPGVPAEVSDAVREALAFRASDRLESARALAEALGGPVRAASGTSLAVSNERLGRRRGLLESLVRAIAGSLDAAAVSIAVVDPATAELEFSSAWGAGASEVVGVQLKGGVGVAGAAAETGKPQVVGHCRSDPRFAAAVANATGYVPYTMLVLPLSHEGATVGVLSILDRRNGEPYRAEDIPQAQLFADVAVEALVS